MAKLNDASLATVSASAPFDPLPENYKGEKLELRIVFRYGYLPDALFKELYESAQRAVANQNYTSAAQLLETLVAQDPDYTNAWNYLGWIYNRLHKYDKAEDSLKKAIEVNPRDLLAYNNLGQAYAYQKRYDEAIPQYLKQLDINKNDRYANANLGRVYLELKQYDKAISALKSGATADPKDPTVFYNLGRAYAKNNQMDDAKEAFKKSVDLEPMPMRFNNVAYQMAVLNVDLHAAQHYAETGLGALATKMRNVSLEQIGGDDSRMTTQISYLWGTLGWTLFEEGRVPEGEKYIKSAWLLRSNGEIGYNLGRVYEAQGRRDDAIRTYMSCHSVPLSPTQRHVSALRYFWEATVKSIIVSTNGGLNLPTSAPFQSLTPITLMAWRSFGFCFLQGPKSSERSSLREMRFSAPLQRSWRLLPIQTPFLKPRRSGSSAGVGWLVSAERALLAGCCWPLLRRFARRSKIVCCP